MMNGRFTTAMAAVLLGLGMLALVDESTAQTGAEYRRRNKSRLAHSKQWYDPALPSYRIQYPALKGLPFPAEETPRSVRSSYLYIDTLMRSQEAARMLQQPELKGVKGRTVSRIASYLYQLNDYNPVMFAQYADGIDLHRNDPYRVSMRQISNSLYNRLHSDGGRQGNAIYSALHADYILRVKIRMVDPSFDEGQLESHFYRVTAEVIDTLKGRYFQPYERSSLAIAAASSYGATIQFQYTPDNYLDPAAGSRDRDDVSFPYKIDDPAFLTAEGRFGMTPGQEAIVFLRHDDHLVDAEHDYYYLHLDPWASNNALPIVDGKVRDLNHVWSDQDLLPYRDWRSKFLSVAASILHS